MTEVERKLLAAARAARTSDAVPYAFEKRISARLAGCAIEHPALPWNQALWRGAMACVTVALLCSAWAYSPLNSHWSSGELSQDLESTILASIVGAEPAW